MLILKIVETKSKKKGSTPSLSLSLSTPPHTEAAAPTNAGGERPAIRFCGQLSTDVSGRRAAQNPMPSCVAYPRARAQTSSPSRARGGVANAPANRGQIAPDGPNSMYTLGEPGLTSSPGFAGSIATWGDIQCIGSKGHGESGSLFPPSRTLQLFSANETVQRPLPVHCFATLRTGDLPARHQQFRDVGNPGPTTYNLSGLCRHGILRGLTYAAREHRA